MSEALNALPPQNESFRWSSFQNVISAILNAIKPKLCEFMEDGSLLYHPKFQFHFSSEFRDTRILLNMSGLSTFTALIYYFTR